MMILSSVVLPVYFYPYLNKKNKVVDEMQVTVAPSLAFLFFNQKESRFKIILGK